MVSSPVAPSGESFYRRLFFQLYVLLHLLSAILFCITVSACLLSLSNQFMFTRLSFVWWQQALRRLHIVPWYAGVFGCMHKASALLYTNTSCPRFDPKLIHIHISVHRPWSSISSISCRWESVGWWFRPSVSPCLSLHVFACLCFSLSLSLSLCAWAHHCGLLCLVLLMKWTYSLIKTFNIILAIAESASE